MMKPFVHVLLGTAILAGCAGQPRTEAPAPVESSRSRVEPPPPPPPPPKEETVAVYAYRPPSAAPDAPPPAVTEAPATAKAPATGPLLAPPSEAAVSRPPAATPGGTFEVAPPPARPVTAAPAPEVAPAPPPEIVAYAAPPPPMPPLPPAVQTLAEQAERQRQKGDYVNAAATLERALRIQPQEAYLYNRLARIRLDQGRYDQAGNFARRSNALTKDQGQIRQGNWGMIAVARRVSGDAEGAAEAEARARGG